MNKELAKKWVAALRSGEYKQGTGCLKNLDGTYCCLGVLAEVAGFGNSIEKPTGIIYSFEMENFRFTNTIPEHTWEKEFGFPKDFDSELINKNDSRYYTFSQIADIIEAKLCLE